MRILAERDWSCAPVAGATTAQNGGEKKGPRNPAATPTRPPPSMAVPPLGHRWERHDERWRRVRAGGLEPRVAAPASAEAAAAAGRCHRSWRRGGWGVRVASGGARRGPSGPVLIETRGSDEVGARTTIRRPRRRRCPAASRSARATARRPCHRTQHRRRAGVDGDVRALEGTARQET